MCERSPFFEWPAGNTINERNPRSRSLFSSTLEYPVVFFGAREGLDPPGGEERIPYPALPDIDCWARFTPLHLYQRRIHAPASLLSAGVRGATIRKWLNTKLKMERRLVILNVSFDWSVHMSCESAGGSG